MTVTLPRGRTSLTILVLTFAACLWLFGAVVESTPSCDSGVVVPMTVAPPVVVGTVGGGS